MNNLNFTRALSLLAGLISALSILYLGLSGIWGLPYANEVFLTGGLVVTFISSVLAVYTGQKLKDDYTQEGVRRAVQPDTASKKLRNPFTGE